MKQLRYISFYIALFAFCEPLFSGIECADQSATIELTSGTTLRILGENQAITGTFIHEDGGVVSGNYLAFSNGILLRNGKTALLTGRYAPQDGNKIILDGSSSLDTQRGFIVESLEIAGANNTLAGTPLLSGALTLGENVDLICDLDGRLSKPIVINQGTVTLAHDLLCESNAIFAGTGTVDCADYPCTLAQHYASPLDGVITWKNATNLKLSGNMTLASQWTFFNDGVFDGNGQELFFATGGSLKIPSGVTLTLRDLHLRGVTSSSFVFEDATSVLRLERSEIHINEEVTLAQGHVYVSSNSSMVLKNHNFIFGENAKLTINDATLDLNVFNNAGLPDAGTVYVPNPVYIDHVWQTTHVAANEASGQLSFLNGGRIIEIGERTSDQLFSSNLAGTLELDQSSMLGPGDVIHIKEDTTLDGKGACVMFARPSYPQFIIDPGKTATLKDIELAAVKKTTFQLGKGARVLIGDNVTFTLSDDLVWEDESIEITGETNVFTIKGVGAPRRLTFSSHQTGGDLPHQFTYEEHLKLGSGTLHLDNIVLKGTRYISAGSADVGGLTVRGTILLGGNATIELNEPLTDHYFLVKGLGNRLHCLLGSTTLAGSWSFDDDAVSGLSVRFVLPESMRGMPRLLCDAGSFDLSSENGQASVLFENHNLEICNATIGAFKLGHNAHMQGSRITVTKNALQQYEADAVIAPGTQLLSNLDSGALVFDQTLLSQMKGPFLRTGLSAYEYHKQMAALDMDLTRSVQIPDATIDTVLSYNSGMALPVLAGNIILREDGGRLYTNARFDVSQAVNLTLKDGVCVEQSNAHTMTAKSTDIINVQGGSRSQPNRIILNAAAHLGGTLHLDDAAHLDIHFSDANDAPVLTLDSSFMCDFGEDARLTFSGKGTVVLPSVMTFDFSTSDGSLVLSDGVHCTVAALDTCVFSGKGAVIVEKGALLTVEDGGVVRVGSSSKDRVNLDVHTGGGVRIGSLFSATSSTQTSYLSLVGSGNSLNAGDSGAIIVGFNGVLEANAFKGAPLTGALNSIDIGMGGSLYVAKDGAVVLADNASGSTGITWNNMGGSVGGSGLITLAGTQFSGQLQGAHFATEGATAASLVASLVQTVETLVSSTVFLSKEGASFLYTKNGSVVALSAQEIIYADTADGVVTGYNTLTGQQFTYDANGVRG